VMGSSVATCSDATSLTTFASSLTATSLFTKPSNFSVAKLFYWSSSAVASSKAHFSWTFLMFFVIWWIIVLTKHWKSISHIPFCSSRYNRSHESWVQRGLSSSHLHSLDNSKILKLCICGQNIRTLYSRTNVTSLRIAYCASCVI